MAQSAKSMGKVVTTVFRFDRASYAKYVTQLIGIASVLYIFLVSVGSNAGFFSNGVMTALKNLSLATIAYLIIAWGVLHRASNPVTTVGFTTLAALVYLGIVNLPLNASLPFWLKQAKSALSDVSLEGAKGGIVATAFTLL